jgi:hypothetical protein
MRRASVVALLAVTLVLVAACDDAKQNDGAAASASAAKTAEPPPPPLKPKTMPELVVDPSGPFLGGTRIDMSSPEAAAKMDKVLAELPIQGSPVTVLADKKAKTPHVAALLFALGRAGAPKAIVKTDGRNDVPKELAFTPETRVSSPPPCSIAAVVRKDLSTAVWPLAGGVAKGHSKGFAGPDLSHTAETLEKSLAGCDSTVAVVSADDTIQWEMTYNLAGTLLVSDKKKRVDTLVLPKDAPVAGRPVTLSK